MIILVNKVWFLMILSLASHTPPSPQLPAQSSVRSLKSLCSLYDTFPFFLSHNIASPKYLPLCPPAIELWTVEKECVDVGMQQMIQKPWVFSAIYWVSSLHPTMNACRACDAAIPVLSFSSPGWWARVSSGGWTEDLCSDWHDVLSIIFLSGIPLILAFVKDTASWCAGP